MNRYKLSTVEIIAGKSVEIYSQNIDEFLEPIKIMVLKEYPNCDYRVEKLAGKPFRCTFKMLSGKDYIIGKWIAAIIGYQGWEPFAATHKFYSGEAQYEAEIYYFRKMEDE